MVSNPLSSYFARRRQISQQAERARPFAPSRPASHLRNSPNTVLGLIRISNPGQSRYSLTVQKKAISAWSKQNGLVIVEWLVLKKSAKKILDQVIEATQRLRPRVLAVYRIDRIFRTSEAGMQKVLRAISPNTTIVSVTEGVDSRHDLSEVRTLVEYATEEARSISRRTVDAMRMVEGDVGRARLGWKYKRGVLCKDPRMQKAIFRIKKLSRKGWSCQRIADILNRGRKTKTWTAQRVWACLNPPSSRGH